MRKVMISSTAFFQIFFFNIFCLTDEKLEADLWLLNSCTVKNPAEHHLRNEINAARALGKKVVVAGCVSQGKACCAQGIKCLTSDSLEHKLHGFLFSLFAILIHC
jgi:tRNA A37 methylthiotransferase MiaB